MSLGYDLSCATLSQEGKIYQIEYAQKAVDNSPTVLGIVCKDGVVFVSEKIRLTKTLVVGSNPSIYSVTRNIGMVICGLLPEGRALIQRAKVEASSYLKNFGVDITGKILADRISLYALQHTLYMGGRPFGASVMISSYEQGAYHLYLVEPSGTCYEYYAATQGTRRQYVKTEVEKSNYKIRDLTVKEGLFEYLKVVMRSYEGEKDTEYDISCLTRQESGKEEHLLVDRQLITEMSARAKAQIEEERRMAID